MATTFVCYEFDASIEMVWELIEGFSDLGAWAPGATLTEVQGEGVGAVRRVRAGESGGMQST
jgi:hypothetical protein